MAGGFHESPLRLNEGLASIEVWNEEQIRARAKKLGQRFVEVWHRPDVSASVVDRHRPAKATNVAKYTIEDHKHLVESERTRGLFEALRTAVLALDPCVTEDFRKLYVAYKAETNFVDVVPQSKRLRLTLNLDFHALSDPLGMATDVTDQGRWGNGSVDVAFDSLEDLPYVMGLIRQSFETQMGSANGD